MNKMLLTQIEKLKNFSLAHQEKVHVGKFIIDEYNGNGKSHELFSTILEKSFDDREKLEVSFQELTKSKLQIKPYQINRILKTYFPPEEPGKPVSAKKPDLSSVEKTKGKTEKAESEIGFKELLEKESKKFVRVRTDYYKVSFTLTSKKEKAPALFYWKKGTITEDWGRDIIKLIRKYDSFVNVPDNTSNYKTEFTEEGNNYFNLYTKPKYFPGAGSIETTKLFLTHIFRDKLEFILDYLKLLYEQPVQKLPVICLISKEQETGKTTFLRWLCTIFDGNGIILGNEDFSNQFNTHYVGKLVIGIDESFIDRNLIKEKIKRMVTDPSINMEAKGRDQVKVDFNGKFVLLSNKETNFIMMEDEDNRFFVCKVPVIEKKDPDIETKLENEIPAFLHYLKQRKLFHQRKTRLWFEPKDYETAALKKIIKSTRSKVEKEMISWLENIFDFNDELNEINVNPIKLAPQIQQNLKTINGLRSEIEHILKDNWNLVPEKNRKFHHPILKEEYDEYEKTMVSMLKYDIFQGKPYEITRSFINSKTENSDFQ